LANTKTLFTMITDQTLIVLDGKTAINSHKFAPVIGRKLRNIASAGAPFSARLITFIAIDTAIAAYCTLAFAFCAQGFDELLCRHTDTMYGVKYLVKYHLETQLNDYFPRSLSRP
jgi:hypothetical protein